MATHLFKQYVEPPSVGDPLDPYATGGLRVWDDYQFLRRGRKGAGGPPALAPIAPVPVIFPPVNTIAPYIEGPAPSVGDVLTVGIGTWTGTEPITYSYEWHRESAVAPTAPVNTVLPLISGTEIEEQTLHCGTGTWDGTPPLTYTYQWYRLIAPTGTAAPVISGTEMEDQILHCTPGTWAGTDPITYAYQWFRVEELLGRNIDDTSEETLAKLKQLQPRRPPRRKRRFPVPRLRERPRGR